MENVQTKNMSDVLGGGYTHANIKKMHSRSVKAERINFIKSFEDNLGRIQNKNRKKIVKTNKNFIFYPRKHNADSKNHQKIENNDFFRLTMATEEKDFRKLKVILTQSFTNLQEL